MIQIDIGLDGKVHALAMGGDVSRVGLELAVAVQGLYKALYRQNPAAGAYLKHVLQRALDDDSPAWNLSACGIADAGTVFAVSRYPTGGGADDAEN